MMNNSVQRSEASARRQTPPEWADILGLWRLCWQTRCRRVRACRGDARACLRQHFPLLPEGVRRWFEYLMVARAYDVPFDEALARLEATPYAEAFLAWQETIARSTQAPPAAP